MSDDVKTMDERLRERAAQALNERVKAAARRFQQELGQILTDLAPDMSGRVIQVQAVQRSGASTPDDSIVSAIADAYIGAARAAAGEHAVAQFIKRVDKLSGDVDELRASVG